MNKDLDRILFSEEEIQDAVKKAAQKITEDYKNKRPLVIGILKGSFIFMADLVRKIEVPCDIDFMGISSYGNLSASSGNVEIKKDLEFDIKNRDIIIIEDILDTAATISFLIKELSKREPCSIKICALLDKKNEKVSNIEADYKCFDIENEFVVGYGLDYAQSYRNLPYVGVLKAEIYQK